MIDIVLRMAGLIALGMIWRRLRPGGLDGDSVRVVTSTLVFHLLLPALVLVTLWRTPIGLDSARIALTAAVIVVLGLGLGRLAAAGLATGPARTGALLLAAAFPNATYMGLPALNAALGPVGDSIAIQFDYFACTPIVLTVGIVLAQRYGGTVATSWPGLELLRVPPFWAALAGVACSVLGIPLPAALAGLLDTLGGGVVPLMLLALGMSLSLRALDRATLRAALPVLVIQLGILPLAALGVATGIGLDGPQWIGTILEAGMPSMVLGIVLCDRYGLDARFYSLIVTSSTLLSLVTLPLWLAVLQAG